MSNEETTQWNSHKDLFEGRKLSHQGHAFFFAEDYMKARIYYEKCLERVEAKNHKKLAICSEELERVYLILGEQQKPVEILTKSLEIRLSVYGEQHSTTATSYNNLGHLYRNLGDHRKAIEMFTKSG